MKWEVTGQIRPASDYPVCSSPVLAPPPSHLKRPGCRLYADIVCAFDIETYTFNAGGTAANPNWQAVLYQWQFQCGLGNTYIGRTWEELLEFLKTYHSAFEETIVVYVHNLSYEFQFLKSVIPIESVFARDKRKVMYAVMEGYEFRCSYMHSNMSLSEYTHKFKVAHPKLDDTVDYSAECWFDTPLSKEQIEYGANDVRGLVEAIYTEMENESDNLYTIPMTSSGNTF